MPKPLAPTNATETFSRGSDASHEFQQRWNTAPIVDSGASKASPRGMTPCRLGPADVLQVGRCFDQIAVAEAALVGARKALSELPLPFGPNSSRQAPEKSQKAQLANSPPTVTLGLAPLPTSKAFGGSASMTSTQSKADWKTMDKAGSSAAVHPVSFDQAIVGCIGSASADSPVKSPILEQTRAQEEFLSTRDIIWEKVTSSHHMSMPMLHPEAKVRFAWTLAGLVFIVYELYAIPVYLAFEVDPAGGFFVFVSIINLYFLMDIICQFFCCYVNHKGVLVSSPKLVARKYLKSWFIPDIVAGIPWEWLSGDDSSVRQMTRSVRFIRAARMFRLARLIRIMKLRSLFERFETKLEASQIFTFVSGIGRIILLVFAILHWGACMWYAIGVASLNDSHADGSAASWVAVHQGDYPYIGEHKWDHYVFSLYFSLTTMTTVGYGDITPTNFSEVSFAMVLLAVSSMVFAGLMGTLTDMIGALNSQRHELAERKMMLSRYMRWRAVPRRLMYTIRQHLLFLWDANEGYDAYEGAIKEQLPPVLRAELCHHIYGRILASAPFFGWMRDFPICTKFLCQKVQSIFLERGDHIFRMGQQNDQVYMLLTGEVVASRNENLFEDTLWPEPGKAGVPSDDLLSDLTFDIPRNKEATVTANVAQVMSMATNKANIIPDRSPTASRTMTRAPTYGTRKSGNDMFDSEVLLMAHVELRRQDVRRHAAARRVQRIWRAKQKRRKGRPPQNSQDRAKQGLKISRMKSRHISAPAYFGEACLWQPLEDWSDPPLYLYTVRCESRGEIIYIPRDAILQCLDRFSPWLLERYQTFAAAVSSKMNERFKTNSELRDWALDFAMADLMETGNDDAALGATHRQMLGREGGHKVPDYEGPAVPRSHLHSPAGTGANEPSPIKRMSSGHFGRSRSNGAMGNSPARPPPRVP
mmetsp:Transcript_78041/g.226417  ORF Transcript_78041/g.226417 Transcript_78041/m.226417 type:complete len:927 (-) Transcript_78041:119-2899(-)